MPPRSDLLHRRALRHPSFVVGALLTAVSAVTQMLAVTWSAAPAAGARMAATQRWLLAGGAIALVVGREADRTWLFAAGGVAVVVSTLALMVILVRIRGEAITPRFGPAIEAYVAAVVAGAIGMAIGVLLGTGADVTNPAALRQVHLTLNLFGLVGLVVADPAAHLPDRDAAILLICQSGRRSMIAATAGGMSAPAPASASNVGSLYMCLVSTNSMGWPRAS